MRCLGKKGQATGAKAAVFVALMALFIIFYILFLPPDVRDEILETGPSYGGGGNAPSGYGTGQVMAVLISEKPGRLDFVKPNDLEVEHNIPSVNLFSITQSEVLRSTDSLYAKNNAFNQVEDDFRFTVEDIDNTHNILFSFKPTERSGFLIIKLNGEVVTTKRYNSEVADPVILPKDILQNVNKLEVAVSEVGWRFWASNEYLLEDVKVLAEVTDVSRQQSTATFTVTRTEKENAEKAYLKFFPDCMPAKAGVLTVAINNNIVFSGVPDCGLLRPISFLPQYLVIGENKITFASSGGNYLIDNIVVKTELKKQSYPVYYFDMKDNIFQVERERLTQFEGLCGQTDGYCPVDCDEDLDIDCCMLSSGKFWCDLPTDDEGDRCAEVVSARDCNRCDSGYEEINGYPPVFCIGECGDDTDGDCPAYCNKNHDLDCCYEDRAANFWCYDLPRSGIDSTCESSLNQAECDDCETGYVTFGEFPNLCGPPAMYESKYAESSVLRPEYDAILKIEFVNDVDVKRAGLYINGHLMHMDTRSSVYFQSIAPYVKPGNNGIELVPESELDIVSMEVTLEHI
jgi:hypothetical protein